MHSIINYSGYQHVLRRESRLCIRERHAVRLRVREAQPGTAQDLSIYRLRPGASAWELVKRYTGTVDAVSQFTMGNAVIDQSGALVVASACALKSDPPNRTATGFQAVWDRVPNVDAPWSARRCAPQGSRRSTPTPEQALALAPIDGTTWPNGGRPYAGDVVSDGKLALRLSKVPAGGARATCGGGSAAAGDAGSGTAAVMDSPPADAARDIAKRPAFIRRGVGWARAEPKRAILVERHTKRVQRAIRQMLRHEIIMSHGLHDELISSSCTKDAGGEDAICPVGELHRLLGTVEAARRTLD